MTHRAYTPIVISSGSLGSGLFDKLKPVTGNQFHILQFEPSLFKDLGLVGCLHTWEWGGGNKWNAPNRQPPEIQHYSGFGSSKQINLLAAEIVQKVNNSIIRGKDIDDVLPELKFTDPGDLEALKRELARQNIGLQLEHGKVLEIGIGSTI